MQWLKYTWASGFVLVAVVLLAGCVVFTLVPLGRESWVPLGVVSALLVGESVRRYLRFGRGSAALSQRETMRRATLAEVADIHVERQRPVVGIIRNVGGTIESYVVIIADEGHADTTFVRVQSRWPRHAIDGEEHLTFSEAHERATSLNTSFLPQSKYSDTLAVWALRP